MEDGRWKMEDGRWNMEEQRVTHPSSPSKKMQCPIQYLLDVASWVECSCRLLGACGWMMCCCELRALRRPALRERMAIFTSEIQKLLNLLIFTATIHLMT